MRWPRKWDALVQAVKVEKIKIKLPPRLEQIREYVLAGRKTNQQIADELGISVNTVRLYVSKVYAIYTTKEK